MKNIRKAIAAVTMMMVLMVGTSFAGIDAPEQQPCTSTETPKGGVILSDMTGVIVHLTGVIVHFTTGVIVHVSRTETPVDCGVIVH